MEVTCYLDEELENSSTFTPSIAVNGTIGYSEAWHAKARMYEVTRSTASSRRLSRRPAPVSEQQQRQCKSESYEDGDIGTLFTICADADPDDVFLEKWPARAARHWSTSVLLWRGPGPPAGMSNPSPSVG